MTLRSKPFLIPAGAIAIGRARIGTLAILLLCASSVTLAQEFLTQARAAADLAAQRVDATRQQERISRVRYDAGLATLTEWLESHLSLIEADADLKVAELNVDEIETGGGPVRTEISAPLIEGRDYFSKRLQIELDTVSAREAPLAEQIRVTEADVAAGVAPDAALPPLTMERARLAAERERIRESLALRQSFLAGEIDAAQAEQRLRALRATARQQTADATLAALRAADGPLQERYAAGVASEDEVLAMTRELRLAEAELLAAQSEVTSIQREISR